MQEECDVEAIGALLEDPTVRTILTETSTRAMSAAALSDRCEASQPTVYRRLEDLRACDLIVEQTEVDPEEGHHRTVYATSLDRIVVELVDGELTAEIRRREDAADRFTRFVEGI